MLALANLDSVRGLHNLFRRSQGIPFGSRKITPYRADRQDDIVIYWRVRTPLLSSSNRVVIVIVLISGISTLSSFIFRGRYPWNSYHKVPSPNVYAHTPQEYPRFLLPLALLPPWSKARYPSVITKAEYLTVSRSPGRERKVVNLMGDDTCSSLPLREMLPL